MTPEQHRMTADAMEANRNKIVEQVNATSGKVTCKDTKEQMHFDCPYSFYRLVPETRKRAMHVDELLAYAIKNGGYVVESKTGILRLLGDMTDEIVRVRDENGMHSPTFQELREHYTTLDGTALEVNE